MILNPKVLISVRRNVQGETTHHQIKAQGSVESNFTKGTVFDTYLQRNSSLKNFNSLDKLFFFLSFMTGDGKYLF